MKKLLVWMSSCIVLIAVMYTARTAILEGIGNFLVIHDRLERADIIFLLNGDPTVRPSRAAALYHDGMAQKVVIARIEDSPDVKLGVYPNPTDVNISMLEKLGVPPGQIVQLRPDGGVKHTFDEAQALLGYDRETHLQKVIIVTSDLHSRRSKFIFQRVLRGMAVKVMLAPVSDLKYDAHNWWTLEDGVVGCQNEYIKLLYYRIKY